LDEIGPEALIKRFRGLPLCAIIKIVKNSAPAEIPDDKELGAIKALLKKDPVWSAEKAHYLERATSRGKHHKQRSSLSDESDSEREGVSSLSDKSDPGDGSGSEYKGVSSSGEESEYNSTTSKSASVSGSENEFKDGSSTGNDSVSDEPLETKRSRRPLKRAESPLKALKKKQKTPPRALEKNRKTPPKALKKKQKTPPKALKKKQKAPPKALKKKQKTPPKALKKKQKTPPKVLKKKQKTPPKALKKKQKTPPKVLKKKQKAPPKALKKKQKTSPNAPKKKWGSGLTTKSAGDEIIHFPRMCNFKEFPKKWDEYKRLHALLSFPMSLRQIRELNPTWYKYHRLGELRDNIGDKMFLKLTKGLNLSQCLWKFGIYPAPNKSPTTGRTEPLSAQRRQQSLWIPTKDDVTTTESKRNYSQLSEFGEEVVLKENEEQAGTNKCDSPQPDKIDEVNESFQIPTEIDTATITRKKGDAQSSGSEEISEMTESAEEATPATSEEQAKVGRCDSLQLDKIDEVNESLQILTKNDTTTTTRKNEDAQFSGPEEISEMAESAEKAPPVTSEEQAKVSRCDLLKLDKMDEVNESLQILTEIDTATITRKKWDAQSSGSEETFEMVESEEKVTPTANEEQAKVNRYDLPQPEKVDKVNESLQILTKSDTAATTCEKDDAQLPESEEEAVPKKNDKQVKVNKHNPPRPEEVKEINESLQITIQDDTATTAFKKSNAQQSESEEEVVPKRSDEQAEGDKRASSQPEGSSDEYDEVDEVNEFLFFSSKKRY
jgi:hypothetical protein